MTAGSRSARIQGLVAKEAARRGARVSVLDVCTAAVAALPIGGAGVSAMSRNSASHPLCSTDTISERLEELQLTLGEGPGVDAFTRGGAVLTPDLRADDVHARWPVFAPAAAEAGADAVFAFPLQIGAISPGVLDMYATTPGGLDTEDLADALAFADTATLLLLGAGGDGPENGGLADLGGYRAEIDQATGMLTEQLGVGLQEAFIRLRAHAYSHGRRLADVAADVVARRLRFPRDPDQTDDDT
ncbi:ANTAR domain-containing protein [Streptomyces sp. NPDC057298]|uniref:ANTAR domain-containing protein n=1 Tax=Streptomyces sp. NPDC057298 TaxID=3346091 RepID=UPI00362E6B1D